MRGFLAAVLIVLFNALPVRADTKTAYVGAARLYGLDKVTVVYPAGEGEDVEINRTSAERRAAFLRHDRGIEAVAVADDEIDDEALAGNLLILGWGNRLLTRKEAPTYFRKTESGRLFLDSIRVEEGEDLLFGHFSPWNHEAQLIFWSRIDPEKERFHVLPLLGSDWAVYHDYLVVAQGMFAKGPFLPPRRNVDAEADLRGKLEIPPAHERSQHYRLHYAAGMLRAGEAEAILKAREGALAEVGGMLGEPPEGFLIELYLYRDGRQKEERTGVATNAHSFADRRESHMTVSHALSDNVVQEALLLSEALMGPCHSTALCEGLAFALMDTLGEGALPAHAAAMIESDKLPAVAHLLDEADMRSIDRRLVMPASGLLASWLRERGLLATAWRGGERAVQALAEAMEIEPAALDDSFRKYVEALGKNAGEDLAFRKALGEVQIYYDRGDTVGMVRALERVLEIRPDDPETLYKLAVALLQAGEPERAEQSLQRILQLELDPSISHLPAFAHYQLGKIYGERGKQKKARAEFETVLELPDLDGAHDRAREALAGL